MHFLYKGRITVRTIPAFYAYFLWNFISYGTKLYVCMYICLSSTYSSIVTHIRKLHFQKKLRSCFWKSTVCWKMSYNLHFIWKLDSGSDAFCSGNRMISTKNNQILTHINNPFIKISLHSTPWITLAEILWGLSIY